MQVKRPGTVGIACQHHNVVAVFPEHVQNPFTIGGITIPRIKIQRQAQLTAFTQHAVSTARHGIAHLRCKFFIGNLRYVLAAHNDLLADDLPGDARFSRVSDLCRQPAFLLSANDGSRIVCQLAAYHIDVHVVSQLLVAAHQTGVHHDQRRQITEVEAAVDNALLNVALLANGQPLIKSLNGSQTSYAEVTLTLVSIVVLCAILKGVVGDFVVIPHTDKRMSLMHCLQIRITAVESITHAVIFNRHYFV